MEKVSARWEVPLVAILALAMAESDLQIDVRRQGPYPDWSCGLMQVTVQNTAFSPGEWEQYCAFMSDPMNSLDAGAVHFNGNLGYTDANFNLKGDERLIMAMRCYNGGGYGSTDAFAQSAEGKSHIARYRAALARAHEILGE